MSTGTTDRGGRAILALCLLATGFGALVLQVTWQRVIALHSGVDLSSSVTVVAAFLAGLGIGNLLGGRVADRRDPAAALRILGMANLGVAAAAAVSTWFLYDLYRDLAPQLQPTWARFAFNLTLLLVPTVLQGMSLPLVARAVVSDAATAGTRLGRFHAANTVGAAAGALVGAFVLVGSYGFTDASRIAGGIYVGAAVLALGLGLGPRWRSDRPRWVAALAAAVLLGSMGGALAFRLVADRDQVAILRWPVGLVTAVALAAVGWLAVRRDRLTEPGAEAEPIPGADVLDTPEAAAAGTGRTSAAPWFWIYGATGGVALGFELVFFRLVDGIMRSNSYTFGLVLALYLGLLGLGSALGAGIAPRVHDQRRAFLWAQWTVGVGALASLLVVIVVAPDTLLAGPAHRWFTSDGFAAGFLPGPVGDKLLFGVVLPLAVMAVPVLAMGASFPFVQGLVTTDVETVGRQTGRLTAANLLGNVIGSIVAGFVLIEGLGTAGTYRVLFLPLAALGVLAALLARRPAVRVAQVAAVGIVSVLLFVAMPTNHQLWAILHDTPEDRILVAEDRSCASAVKLFGDSLQLSLNGASQNGHPFDDFHVMIGLLPSLAHPEPSRSLAIGLGIGSTSNAMLVSDRIEHVTSVELCGGNYELVDRLADRGIADYVRLRDDPRHEEIEGDGRRHLLVTDRTYDVIVPDTLRPNSASSGNLYSGEFQDLVDARLSDDGITAGWVPSVRALNAVSTHYPYVEVIQIDTYNDSQFYLASRSPIRLDPEVLLERFDAMPADALPVAQRARLRTLIANLDAECVNDGEVAARPRPSAENHDLRPRDEYVLNNPAASDDDVARTCGP